MHGDVESRIANLERSNRWLRLAFGLLALTAVALLTTAMGGEASKPALEALRVSSLDVVNDDGVTVVHLGVRSSGAGGFWLTDAEGNRVVHVNQSSEAGGRVAVSTPDGSKTAVLSADAGRADHSHLDPGE